MIGKILGAPRIQYTMDSFRHALPHLLKVSVMVSPMLTGGKFKSPQKLSLHPQHTSDPPRAYSGQRLIRNSDEINTSRDLEILSLLDPKTTIEQQHKSAFSQFEISIIARSGAAVHPGEGA